MQFLQSLNFLDILFIIVILILSLFASVKGLFKNIVLLVLVIFAVILASSFAEAIQKKYTDSIISNVATSYVVSFVLVLLGAYLITSGVMKIFFKKNQEKDGFSNTILSFVVAMIRFTFILSIICSTLNSFDSIADNKLWKDSKLVPSLTEIGDLAFNTKVNIEKTDLKDYVPEDVAGG